MTTLITAAKETTLHLVRNISTVYIAVYRRPFLFVCSFVVVFCMLAFLPENSCFNLNVLSLLRDGTISTVQSVIGGILCIVIEAVNILIELMSLTSERL